MNLFHVQHYIVQDYQMEKKMLHHVSYVVLLPKLIVMDHNDRLNPKFLNIYNFTHMKILSKTLNFLA